MLIYLVDLNNICKFASKFYARKNMPRKNLETYSLDEDMRKDLMKCYREVAPNCLTQMGAWVKTANHRAKRYYITDKIAVAVVKAHFDGIDMYSHLKPTSRERYECLIQEVLRVANEPKFQGASLPNIVRAAVRRPAPKFFLSPLTVKNIFTRVKYKRYDKNGMLKPQYHY